MARPTPDSRSFYSRLTPYYHLIFPDWDESIRRQATALDTLFRETWPPGVSTILDVSCGIGTQSLGLASLGYQVTASDLCPEEVERAKQEAALRQLQIDFSTADMRIAHEHHGKTFDVVISCDNSVPHLLDDHAILDAFRQMFRCTRPGGGCVISVRDYGVEDLSQPKTIPHGVREVDGARWTISQTWQPRTLQPRGDHYDLTMTVVEDRGDDHGTQVHEMHATYYAIPIPRLRELMTEAGFREVARLDERFYQPLVIGTRPPG